MGRPAACAGYELMANLTFPSATDPFNPWPPIGIADRIFNTTIDINGRTLTGLNVTAVSNAGMFSILGNNSVIRDLGLISPIETSTSQVQQRTYAGALWPPRIKARSKPATCRAAVYR